MQSIQLQNDSLVEISTFLIRRWSEKDDVVIEISNNIETKTKKSKPDTFRKKNRE
jgi:hypothetical protein